LMSPMFPRPIPTPICLHFLNTFQVSGDQNWTVPTTVVSPAVTFQFCWTLLLSQAGV